MNSLIEAVTATKTRTKTTPKAINETVRRLRLLYRRKFRTVILARLNIIFAPLFPLKQATVFQGVDDFRLANNSRIVSRKDKGDTEIISHLFHQSENHVCGLMIQVRGRLIRKDQFRLGDQRASDRHALLL